VQREMSKEILKIAAFYYFSSPLTMWGEKRKPQEDDLVAAKSPNYFHKKLWQQQLFYCCIREWSRGRLMVSVHQL
jgi:hypothetical protein